MTAVVRDLYIEQGATFAFGFTWCRESDPPVLPPQAGLPYDLTGAEVRMQIRTRAGAIMQISASSTGPSPMIMLGGPAVGGVFDPTNGRIDVVIPDTATDLLTAPKARYDLEIKMADGTVRRLLQGEVIIDPNITQVAP